MRKYLLTIIIALSLCGISEAKDYIDGLEGEEFEVTQWDGLPASPSISPTNTARIFYNGTTDKLQLSVNGGAYADISTGGSAPTDADYLVGTANGSLSAEIVVGATPGGELGGTWAAPTIDDLFLKLGGDTTTGNYDFTAGNLTTTGDIFINQTIAYDEAGSIHVAGVNSADGISLTNWSTTNGYCQNLEFSKAASNTIGTYDLVADGETLGKIIFQGADGTDFAFGAVISALIDGTPGAGDMPTKLVFSTTPDGTESSVERMRIDASGEVNISNNTEVLGNYYIKWKDLTDTTTYAYLMANSTNTILSSVAVPFQLQYGAAGALVQLSMDTNGNLIWNYDAKDCDFTINKNTAGQAYVYTAGTDTHTFSGAIDAGAATSLEIPNSNASPSVAGQIMYDTTVAGIANGCLEYFGADVRYLVDLDTVPTDAEDDKVVAYDKDADKFYMKSDATGAGATAWDDIADPDADTTIALTGFETLLTSTLDEAAHTVFTITDTDADLANAVTLLKLTYTDDGSANGNYLNCLDNASGDSKFSIGVDGNTLIAGTLGVTGAITGNLTGNASGSSGSCTGNAVTASTAAAGDSATAFFGAGTIEHERGGLEADVSAYAGLVKITGGATSAVTLGIADTNVAPITVADVADNDYAKFTATGLEGRSYSEVLSDIGAEAADVNIIKSGEIDTMAELDTIVADENLLCETEIDASSELLLLIDDETGTGVIVFNNSPTFADTIQLGENGADGQLIFWAEQATDRLATLNPNSAMASDANFYLPSDEPVATSIMTMTTGGVITNQSASAGLYGALSDETGSAAGTPLAVFNVNPTLTGATIATTTAFNFGANRIDDGADKVDDDMVAFDDGDSNWTATTIGAALEELDDVLAGGTPNQATGKVDWSELVNVPAGFADGVDGGGGGASISQSINQVGHGFAVGNVLKFAGGVYAKAQANSATNAEVVGIVSVVAGADDFTLLYGGYIDTLAGLDDNEVYFLDDDTAGLLTLTEPTDVGDISKPLLIAISATAGYFYNFRGTEIAGGGAGTAWDDIDDPDADATIAFAGYEEDITSTLDEASHTVFTITNTDADRANDTTIFGLADNDQGDVNAIWMQFVSDADGTPDIDFQIAQNATATAVQINLGLTGVLIYDDADGAITFKGNSAGADEDMTINLDDTADKIVISSSTSANEIQLSGLDLLVGGGNINTGAIALVVGDATTTSMTFTTDGTGNAEFTFPADVIGDADIDWGSGAGQVDLADIPGGISGANVWDLGGATSFEIPNSADPDLTVEGQLSWDTDDDTLRGIDANAGNQFVVGQKLKIIAFTVTNPDLLTETAFLPIWTNRTGFTFNIIAVYSRSDVDDAVYTLKYTTNDDTDHTNLTTIEAITISTNGTGCFYNDLTAGIDDTTIETGKTIGFDNGATDCDFIHGVIVGYLDGDVN